MNISKELLFEELKNYENVNEMIATITDENELLYILNCMLIPILRNGFQNGERAAKLFKHTEAMGGHLLPVHFYSPLPDTANLKESIWDARVPIEMDSENQLKLLADAAQYYGEISDYHTTGKIGGYPLVNPAFCVGDAVLYYCILRHYQPKRLIEVGCGYSSLLAREACRRQSTHMVGIEPFPFSWLTDDVHQELKTCPVQDIPVEYFRSLDSGDILFIDSTHVVKAGSDVHYLFLNILPQLKPGVIVHVHDIFLPFEYPYKWIQEKNIFWNEQYLLAAVVQGGGWEVLAANHWLNREHGERLTEIFPGISPGGGSWWMRKRFPLRKATLRSKVCAVLPFRTRSWIESVIRATKAMTKSANSRDQAGT